MDEWALKDGITIALQKPPMRVSLDCYWESKVLLSSPSIGAYDPGIESWKNQKAPKTIAMIAN